MGNIPLPALGVQPQQQPDPLSAYAKALNIKGALQSQKFQQQAEPLQIQAQTLQNQQQQQQIKDSQLFMQSMISHKGDMNAALEDAAANGMSGQGYWNHANQILQRQVSLAKLTGDQLQNQSKVYDQLDGQLQPFKALPPDQQAAQWPTVRAQIVQTAPQLDKVAPPPNQPPNPQQLTAFEAALLGGKTSAENAIKQQEAGAQTTRAEAAMISAKNPTLDKAIRDLANPDPSVSGSAGAWIKNYSTFQAQLAAQKAQGEIPAEVAKAQAVGNAEIPIAAAKAVAAQKATQSLLEGPGKDMAAENYFQTGQLPAGARSPGMISSVINRAAELHPGGNVAGNKAAYQANKSSFENVTKTLDTLSAFENTGLKNLQNFTNLVQKIPDTEIPWLNTPVRLINNKMLGSPDQAAALAAGKVALREIARVTSDPKLSGALTDEARNEVSSLIPDNATIPQIKRVAQVLQQDMANVHQGLSAQKADIGSRLGIQSPATGQQTTTTGQPPPAGPKVGDIKTFPNGAKGKWDGIGWVKQ